MTYAEIRQQVVATLAPDLDPAHSEALLQGIAHAAVSGGPQAAALELLTAGGPERRDLAQVERVYAGLAEHFAEAIAQVAAETSRLRALGLDDQALQHALWQDLIRGPG